jgi:four helix bundle protein
MKDNIIQKKSFQFAIRIVKLYKHLKEVKNEYILSKQILRAGTSIGANIEEAIGGYSELDFLHKMTISYKETRETIYWLKLLEATDYINKSEFESLFVDAEEIIKIITKIQKTIKNKSNAK